MVVNNFNLGNRTFIPAEAYPPLFIDADTELTFPITGQPFKLVVGWNPKEGESGGSINLHQLAPGHTLNLMRNPDREDAVENFFRLFAAKRSNHGQILPYCGTNVKRLYVAVAGGVCVGSCSLTARMLVAAMVMYVSTR